MQIRIFNIPLTDSGDSMNELNRFLASCKVLEIEQRFYQNEKGGCWSFCVRYLNSSYPQGTLKEKVDYKQTLSEPEFARFSRLREIRKELATADAVPAYAVFTDEELAGIARLPELTSSALSTINGVGEKKLAKYGQIVVEKLNKENRN